MLCDSDHFKFKYDSNKKDFRLIGRELSNYKRNDPSDTSETSWNYLTGKLKTTKGKKIAWQNIKMRFLHVK